MATLTVSQPWTPTTFREAPFAELPRFAQALARDADSNGWDVRLTYSEAERGDERLESFAVRLHRSGTRLAAIWTRADSGSWKYRWGVARSRTFTLTELRRVVADDHDIRSTQQ